MRRLGLDTSHCSDKIGRVLEPNQRIERTTGVLESRSNVVGTKRVQDRRYAMHVAKGCVEVLHGVPFRIVSLVSWLVICACATRHVVRLSCKSKPLRLEMTQMNKLNHPV